VSAPLPVLLIDHDGTRRELSTLVLRGSLDLPVAAVADAVALGDALRAGPYSAVVAAWPCDWLPDAALRERLRSALADTPLVLLVDALDEPIARQALAMRAADLVVSDPTAALRLRDAVRRAVGRPGITTSPGVAAPPPRPAEPPASLGPPVTRRERRGAPSRPPEPELLPPTMPGVPLPGAQTAAPDPEPSPAPTRAEAPTATMRALDRANVKRSAEEPTELGRPGLETLLDQAALGWFRCQLGGRLIDCNQALATLAGAEGIEQARERFARLGLDEERWQGLVSRVRRRGRLTESRLELTDLAGNKRYVTLTARGASLAADRPPVLEGVAVDQTETEGLWRRLEGLRVDGSAADGVIDLEAHRRRVDEAVRAELEPVGLRTDPDRLRALSHDLQEPLRTVRIYAEMLAENHAQTLPDEAIELLSLQREAAARVEKMVATMVSTELADSEPPTADSGKVLDEVLANLAATIDQTGARIERGFLPRVAIPASRLLQVLQNLVGNAIKYRSDRPPRILIESERGNGEWEIRVGDNGAGIPDEHQSRVFDMFERGADVESVPGSGIGLAVCRRVVEGHGGRIWVESTPGEGSTFHFTAPGISAGEAAAVRNAKV
jgi:signal transduction histidine kinase